MTTSVRFLLGTHQPGWLGRASVPLFVSDRRLRVYKTLPVALGVSFIGGYSVVGRVGAD
jgi:hypothetical protein